MKKVLLIIGLLSTVTLVNSYNYPSKENVNNQAYAYKTLEVVYDSKKRPHKIVVYSAYRVGMAAIDLDANTYK